MPLILKTVRFLIIKQDFSESAMIVSAKKTLIEKNFSITLDKQEAICYLKTVMITIIKDKIKFYIRKGEFNYG